MDSDESLTRNPDSNPDHASVQAALQRTEDFEPLYERYAMAIYRYCFNQTRDPDIANDLTAQVFVRAIERLHQYRPQPGATFRSWLFSIARNIVIDHWRRHRPTRPVEGAMFELRSDAPGPEEIAVHRSRMAELRDALDHLPPHYRDIVELRLAGLSNPEIARAMGITESAMKSAQTRAYRRLRRILEPTGGSSR